MSQKQKEMVAKKNIVNKAATALGGGADKGGAATKNKFSKVQGAVAGLKSLKASGMMAGLGKMANAAKKSETGVQLPPIN